MAQMSREDFTDKVQEYIKRINQIAEEQGYSVMMAYYIGGSEAENSDDDFIIDWRNMSLNDNLYAMSRWTQDVMNNFDESADEDKWGKDGQDFAIERNGRGRGGGREKEGKEMSPRDHGFTGGFRP